VIVSRISTSATWMLRVSIRTVYSHTHTELAPRLGLAIELGAIFLSAYGIIPGSNSRLGTEQTMDSVLRGSPTRDPTCRAQVDVSAGPLPPSLSLSVFPKLHQYLYILVTKTFQNVFRSGARSSPTAPRASSTPSRTLSKRTSSYGYLPHPSLSLSRTFFFFF
jgi:hypothetical protein